MADSGLRTRTASTTEQALEILDQYPGGYRAHRSARSCSLGGLELLKRIRESYPQTAVIVLTQYGTIESAVEATRIGRRRLRHEAFSHSRTARQAGPCGPLA